ncbi:hypothetical protein ABZ816_18120 [Actinosynnema sp. NPDC047251]|uniref:LSDAT prokaryote domain-containing protein n=1 Tax=Saccharothrix espanaensis (strain ATCC 51144 / DSM 44229 / JCM 9112 / NBRC 15066 / NRRL 15764) TaxID=1179773 RepID=K0K7A0_SACES|nr:hypothetical protein [Saccharothrix espanaensis]CCH33422.1 hypothetical protein BN6_61700 [Saccharothrix espanaensis DSM 44229]
MRVTSPAGGPLPGLPSGRPVLVLVGGADGMAAGELARLCDVFADLVPVLDALGAAVVDGGTDSGAMRAIGRARARRHGRFPLIGVVAEGVPAVVEPHHTAIVRVPGERWGDESPWLASIATEVAGGRPTVTVLVNGGDITFQDATASLALGRPLVVVRGTGRAADAIAGASGPGAALIADSPLTTVVAPAGLAAHVDRVLRG